MIAVTCWHDTEFDRWNGEVVDRTEVNATGRDQDHMRELLVDAYARVTGETITPADLDLTIVARPSA